jgi:hypothetical protein
VEGLPPVKSESKMNWLQFDEFALELDVAKPHLYGLGEGTPQLITSIEPVAARLLAYLAQQCHGKVVRYCDLEAELWPLDQETQSATVRTYAHRANRAMGKDLIGIVRGDGLCLKVRVTKVGSLDEALQKHGPASRYPPMRAEERSLLSKYLQTSGLEPKQLASLIAAIFSNRYPNLIEGASAGEPDESIDILHFAPDGIATVWCVTKIKGNLVNDLTRDVIRLLRTIQDRRLSTIYLCTCEKVSKGALQRIRTAAFEERDRISKDGQDGIADVDVQTVDCGEIARRLTEDRHLEPYKEELKAKIKAGVELPEQGIRQLQRAALAEDDLAEGLIDIADELDDEPSRHGPLTFEKELLPYSGVDQTQNEAQILAAVDSALVVADATAKMSFAALEKQAPALRQRFKEHLWPTMLDAFPLEPALLSWDVRLAACAIYVDLLLAHRSNSLSIEQVENAHRFVLASAARNRLVRHLATYRLCSLMFWLNHRYRRFAAVTELIEVIHECGFRRRSKPPASHEERVLLLGLATLGAHAMKHRDGDDAYRLSLAGCFDDALTCLSDGFWRSCLGLIALLYDDRSSADWATARAEFVRDFNGLAIDSVKTLKQAVAYLELHTRYIELTETEQLTAEQEKLRVLDKLVKQVGDNVRFTLRRLFIELRTASFCPWNQVASKFLALEALVRKKSYHLGSVWGRLVRLRLLRLFLFRVMDSRVIRDESLLKNSRLIEQLRDTTETKDLRQCFGISQCSRATAGEPQRDVAVQLRQWVRPLVTRGLQSYANVLANGSLPDHLLARTTLEYVDFLTNAEGACPNLEVAAVFQDFVSRMEAEAEIVPTFHYYLGQLYRKHNKRDLENALQHFTRYWETATNLERSRRIGDYVKTLYESYLYVKRDPGYLDRVIEIGSGFVTAGNKRHLVSCYLGFALVLKGEQGVSGEIAFLVQMGDVIQELGRQYHESYHEFLLQNTVYGTEFHRFLEASSSSNIACGLLASLGSPEVYNELGTFFLQKARDVGSAESMDTAKRLYDIAVGLARGGSYYLPKFRFNRIRCDFFECQLFGSSDEWIGTSGFPAMLDELHKLGPQFPWARRFVEKEVADYLCTAEGVVLLQRVVEHPHFGKYWRTLKGALAKRKVIEVHVPE